jgi:6-pyruvoyltetrahydropterin/6-carboxytetrahydropterin synthase
MMATPRATVIVGFDFGHRLRLHKGKCRHFHGHRGTMHVTFSAAQLNDQSMVVDFDQAGALVRNFLQEWDHNMLVEVGDPFIEFAEDNDVRVCVLDRPPTAENLAKLAYEELNKQVPEPIYISCVVLFETPSFSASYP